jgi:hypothetical protein
MTKATKTFKIGEYAKGGVITVEVKGNEVTVIGKEWDYSAGSNKSSNQSNAKEFSRKVVDVSISERPLVEELNDLTTSYYAGQIMEWIETKVKINRRMFW